MVVVHSAHKGAQSRHGPRLTALRARYRVVRKVPPPAYREEVAPITSGVRDAINQAIVSFEASLSEFSSQRRESFGRFDLDDALRVLKTTPHERHQLDNVSRRRVREILDEVDAEETTDRPMTNAAENLDAYIYDPGYGPR